MRHRVTYLGLLAIWLILKPSSALGSTAPSGSWVVVSVGACDDPNLSANASLVREALAKLLGAVVLSSDAAQDRFGVFPPVSLDKASRGFTAMRKHYMATEFAASYDAALAADASLQHSPPSAEEAAARLELNILTIESLIHGGQEALAQAMLERVAELEPQMQLDPLKYPPSLERMWTVAKTHLATQELEPMRIAGPLGARVFLDGLNVGDAPVEARVRSGESFDLQFEKAGLVSRHYSASPASCAFTAALVLADEARFRASPDVCYDAASLSAELAQSTLLRSLDVGGPGRFGTRSDLIDNIVLVSLESEGSQLLSAGLWSRSAAAVVRQAKIATLRGAADPDVATNLAQFIATGERTGSDALILP